MHVVPSSITFNELEALHPDGVFFSNGPGDPEQAAPEVNLLRQVLDAGYPFFGICFGNQLLGRALGFGTYKLKFGHRVDIPAFSVQYHPEAAAGPHDAAYLFDRFVDLMRSAKEGTRNA